MKNHRVRTVTRKITEEKKTCLTCREEFWGAKKSKFCSAGCRDTDFRQQNREHLRRYQAEYYQAHKAKRVAARA